MIKTPYQLDPALLRRPTTIMGTGVISEMERTFILRLNCADSGFTPRSRTFDNHINFLNTIPEATLMASSAAKRQQMVCFYVSL